VCIVITAKSSGGNLNPAVSTGLVVGGALEPYKAALYAAVQILGAVAAALLAAGVNLDAQLNPPGLDSWGDANAQPRAAGLSFLTRRAALCSFSRLRALTCS
jgi:hypothetical protein